MGSDSRSVFDRSHGWISIHAPRMGSDSPPLPSTTTNFKFQSTLPAWGATTTFKSNITNGIFQSTLPAWGATKDLVKPCLAEVISIHAPRMGSDSTVKAYSNDRIKWSTLREPHFLYSKNACFSPIVSMCAATSRTKNQRISVSFGSYPGLAPTCFTLDWYRFPRL